MAVKKGEQWAKLWLKLERIKEFCSGWLERGINLAPCSPDNAPISTLKCRLLRILPATNRELVLYYRGFWSQWASVTFEEAGEGREQAATAPRKIKINLRERGDDSGEQKCRLAEKEEHKMVLGAMGGGAASTSRNSSLSNTGQFCILTDGWQPLAAGTRLT